MDKKKIFIFVAVFCISFIIILLTILSSAEKNKTKSSNNQNWNNTRDLEKIDLKDFSLKDKENPLVDNLKIKKWTEDVVLTDSAYDIQIINDNKNFKGFQENITSLSDSYNKKYSPKIVNKFNLNWLYFIQSVQWVPVLKFIEFWKNESVELDIDLPPDSVKHKIIDKNTIWYLIDVDVIQDWKTLEILNIKTKEKTNFYVSDENKYRISSWFADPTWKKIIITEEFTPTSDDLVSTNTLFHKSWVYDLWNPSSSWTLVFDQKNDVMERWPIFWSSEDNKIYFNSCNVATFHCDYEITKLSPDSNKMEKTKWLWNFQYAAQPILSPNWNLMAFPAWNWNKSTKLYKKWDDITNSFVHKNVLKVFDIKQWKTKTLVDFGDYKNIDNIFWSPDWTKILFQLRAITEDWLTSNSKWIWYYDFLTWKFAQLIWNFLALPSHIYSWFKASDDGEWIFFTVVKMYPKTSFKNSDRNLPSDEKDFYYIRIKDMQLLHLWTSVRSILKTDFL